MPCKFVQASDDMIVLSATERPLKRSVLIDGSGRLAADGLLPLRERPVPSFQNLVETPRFGEITTKKSILLRERLMLRRRAQHGEVSSSFELWPV